MLVCRKQLSWLFPSIIGLSLLTSCASYNQQVQGYYENLRQGNYEKAAKALDGNRLLKKNRNRLLFFLERGKVCHLLGQWDSSNTYFNQADEMMEDARNSAKDIAVSTLVNPMMQTYKAEDFEKYLVHYYKALNYIHLNKSDDALVEARRITLRTNTQEDKVGNRNKYSDDAFSLTVQGMIYEQAKDINNAFISYRNAVNIYLDNNGNYYGTELPEQLKKDVLRLADLNGFQDELSRYEKLFGMTFQKGNSLEGGELILFWENGSAPIKAQQDIWFSLIKNSGGNFFFTDANGLYNIPFDNNSGYNSSAGKLEDLRSFRVALPKYEAQQLYFSGASLLVNNQNYKMEQAENINTLAFTTLKERMLKELSSTLTRLAIKKLAEAALRPNAVKDDKDKTEEQKKKEQKRKNEQEALALGLQLFNFVSEKADTRNWQSLPHSIYYIRIPLQTGLNNITVQLSGNTSASQDLKVTGTGSLQFQSISSLK